MKTVLQKEEVSLFLLASLLDLLGIYLANPIVQLVRIILFPHTAMDRLMGYGLKYETGFKYTHFGFLEKKHHEH